MSIPLERNLEGIQCNQNASEDVFVDSLSFTSLLKGVSLEFTQNNTLDTAHAIMTSVSQFLLTIKPVPLSLLLHKVFSGTTRERIAAIHGIFQLYSVSIAQVAVDFVLELVALLKPLIPKSHPVILSLLKRFGYVDVPVEQSLDDVNGYLKDHPVPASLFLGSCIIAVIVAITAFGVKSINFSSMRTNVMGFLKDLGPSTKGLTDLKSSIASAIATLGLDCFVSNEEKLLQAHIKELVKFIELVEDNVRNVLVNPELITKFRDEYTDFIAQLDKWEQWIIDNNRYDKSKMVHLQLKPLRDARVHLKECLAKIESGVNGKQKPVIIWIYGPKGVGKSELARHIIGLLATASNCADTTYVRNGFEAYWSGYAHQNFVVFDDFFQNEESSDLKDLISIYTQNTFILPMARVEDKGLQFHSRFVIICANHAYYTQRTQTAPDANERRRDFLIQVSNPVMPNASLTAEQEQSWFDRHYRHDFSHLALVERDKISTPGAADQPYRLKRQISVDQIVRECRSLELERKNQYVRAIKFPDPAVSYDELLVGFDEVDDAVDQNGFRRMDCFVGPPEHGKTETALRLGYSASEDSTSPRVFNDPTFSTETFATFIELLKDYHDGADVYAPHIMTCNTVTLDKRLAELDPEQAAAVKRRLKFYTFYKSWIPYNTIKVRDEDGKSLVLDEFVSSFASCKFKQLRNAIIRELPVVDRVFENYVTYTGTSIKFMKQVHANPYSVLTSVHRHGVPFTSMIKLVTKLCIKELPVSIDQLFLLVTNYCVDYDGPPVALLFDDCSFGAYSLNNRLMFVKLKSHVLVNPTSNQTKWTEIIFSGLELLLTVVNMTAWETPQRFEDLFQEQRILEERRRMAWIDYDHDGNKIKKRTSEPQEERRDATDYANTQRASRKIAQEDLKTSKIKQEYNPPAHMEDRLKKYDDYDRLYMTEHGRLADLGRDIMDEAMHNVNDRSVDNIVAKNIVNLGPVWGLKLRDNFGVTVSHCFKPGQDYDYHGFKFTILSKIPDKDLCTFVYQGSPCRNIMRHVRVSGQKNVKTCRDASIFVVQDSFIHHYPISLDAERRYTFSDSGVEYCQYKPNFKTGSYPSMFTTFGDCGSPVMSCESSDEQRLLALHTSADTTRGYCVTLMRDEIEKYLPVIKNESSIHKLSYTPVSFENPPVSPTHHECVGTVHFDGKDVKSWVPTKTRIYRSILHMDILDMGSQPAILSSHDFRWKRPEKNVLAAMIDKYDAQTDVTDNKLLVDCATEIGDWYGQILKRESCDIRKLTKTEAISGVSVENSNPIYRHSSAGYPWKLMPDVKHKSTFLTHFDRGKARIWSIDMQKEHGRALNSAVDELTRSLKKGDHPSVLFGSALKDEVRIAEKINSGSTRAIITCPFEYLIVNRQYFHTMHASIMSTRHLHPVKIGMNAACTEWDACINYLITNSQRVFEGDFKSLDKTIPRVLKVDALSAFYDQIARINDQTYCDSDRILRNGCLHLEGNALVALGDAVIQFVGTEISGEPATAVNDAIMVLISLYYIWRIACRIADNRSLSNFADFLHYARTINVGDDFLQALTEVAIDLGYTPAFITKIYAEHFGMTLTNADKDGVATLKDITECHFLKRSIYRKDEYWVGKLCTQSLEKMINFTTSTKPHYFRVNEKLHGDTDVILSTIESITCEASLHGPNVYELIMSSISESCRKFHIPMQPYLPWEKAFNRVYFQHDCDYFAPAV